jgi:hypothetical protein
MQNWVNILGRSQEEDKGIKLAIVALTITMLDLDLEPHIYSVSRELGAKIGERHFRIFYKNTALCIESKRKNCTQSTQINSHC